MTASPLKWGPLSSGRSCRGGGRRKKDLRTVRLVVRRTCLADQAQQALFATWRHHSFITCRTDLNTVEADWFHRNRVVVEMASRELREGGAEHVPSGHYSANAAWFACAVTAHNCSRWAVILGQHEPVNNRTLRARPSRFLRSQRTDPGVTPFDCRRPGRGARASPPCSKTCASCSAPPADNRPAGPTRTTPDHKHRRQQPTRKAERWIQAERV